MLRLLVNGSRSGLKWWLGITIRGKLKMSCYVMLEFTAKPGTDPAALEALRISLAESRTKEGCQSIELTVNEDDRNNMLLGDAVGFAEALSELSRLARGKWRREALCGRDSQWVIDPIFQYRGRIRKPGANVGSLLRCFSPPAGLLSSGPDAASRFPDIDLPD